MKPPTARRLSPRSVAVVLLGLLLLSGLALRGLDTPSGTEAAEETPIDWERARRLHQKAQRGEPLTAEERAYYERARQLRSQRQRRPSGTLASPSHSDGSRERGPAAKGGEAPVPPQGEPPADGFLPAFPGAEGNGARSLGGRGGRVYHVTSLADRGPGSLREGVEAAGPRTIVFDVGGTIEISSSLRIDNPYITIAGQSAPGGGIALKGTPTLDAPLIYVRSHDVVIRYLRVRPGPGARGAMKGDAVSIVSREARDVILDHVSVSWAVDKALVVYAGARNVTLQWSILAETLYCSNHGKTVDWREHGTPGPCPGGGVPHSRAVTISSLPPGPIPGDITLHHNLLAHNNMRHPNVVSAGPVAFINNVIYNLGRLGANLGAKPGGSHGAALDYVGNFIKPGPNTDRDVTALSAPSFITEGVAVFAEGNVGADAIGGLFPPAFARHGFLSDRRTSTAEVTESSARQAYDAVLAGAGTNLPSRDAVDLRILKDVVAGTGGFVNDPDEVGGWPQLDPGSPPTDRDRDGLPADWEARCSFLDDGKPEDAQSDLDGDGYTELEEYLNCLAAERGLAAAATGCSCNPAGDSVHPTNPSP